MKEFIEIVSRDLNIEIVESSASLGFGSSYFCDDHGNIEGIELYRTGLKDLEVLRPIAEHLKVLKLNELILDSIESIDMFTHLEELKMYLESISSLRGLERLKNLKELRVWCEEVSSVKEIETIDSLVLLKLYCPYPPPSLIDLTNLKNLETLQLTGVESREMVHGIEKLKHLDLKNNDIPEISGMEKCLNLEFLSFSSNPLTKLEGLSQLKYLKHLDVSSTQITRIENIEHLKNLETLSLGHNSISRIEGLESLTRLKVLDLTNYLGESITPIEEIHCLDHLTNLETLILSGQRITELKNLPTQSLKLVDVAWNKIERIDYDWLRNIQNPCTITLTGNPLEINPEEVPDHVTIIDERKN